MAIRSRHQGFTLIELMITVAIIAILARLAWPSYQNYVTRTKLTQAFNQLSAYSLTMQQVYQDTRSYATCGATSGMAAIPTQTADFTFSCSGANATTFTASAVGRTGSPADGFNFTINQAGQRATATAPSGWPTNSSCWVRDKAGSCN